MNITTRRRIRFPLLAFLSLLAGSRSFIVAQEEAPPGVKRTAIDAELVIDKGTFARNGQRIPATLRNVVDAITQRYPRTNITIVGVEDVVADTVTVRWPKQMLNVPDTVHPPLHGVLFALKAATGHRFLLEAFGPNDFVLSPTPGRSGSRFAEVFNVAPLLSSGRARHYERQLRELETEYAAVRKVMGDDHPHTSGMRTQMEIAKAHLAQAEPPADATKIIQRIEMAVKLTLLSLKSTEQPPEFSYHPGTNLLILVGGDEAVEVTRKVVTALEKGAN
jgi:hypothetical protein